MAEKNKVSVRIMNQEYTICSEDSREFVQRVANYVDDKMTDISNKNRKLSTALISVLTALNIADDYFKLLDLQKSEKALLPSEEQKFNIVIQSLNEELEKKIKRISELEEVVGLAESKLSSKDEELRKCNENLQLKIQELQRSEENLKQKNNELEIKQKELRKMEIELQEFIETFDENGKD